MKRVVLLSLALAGLVVLSGCGKTYCWKPSVPEGLRTVAVPTFRNESDLMELGAVTARQTLREFQREGTFRIASTDDAALEIQGTIKKVSAGVGAYDRRSGLRLSAYEMQVLVEVSVIDRKAAKVLIDNRPYTATATMTGSQDVTTLQRDASGRAAEDLARQIVDDVLNLKW